MKTPHEPNPKPNPAEAEVHIRSDHQILKALQKKIGRHPEIGAAIYEAGDGAEAASTVVNASSLDHARTRFYRRCCKGLAGCARSTWDTGFFEATSCFAAHS